MIAAGWLAEHGFVYHKIDGDMVLETLANTTVACFQTEPREDAPEL